jgi:MFS family permease
MKKNALIISIFSLSFIGASFVGVAPAMASFAEAFPGQSASSIQLILSLPLVVCVPFTLLSGAIVSKISKKALILIGALLYTIGGTAAFFFDDFGMILAARAVFGAGFGIILPFTISLISDFFYGSVVYQKLIGYQSVVTNLGNITITFIAGFLCKIGWHYVFLVYAIGAIVTLLILFGLPEPPKQEQAATISPKIKVPKIVFFYAFFVLVYSVWMSVTNSHISFLIQDRNLGDASTSGIALTLSTIGGVIGAFLFAYIWKAFGRFTAAISMLLNAIGLLTISFATNLAVVILGVMAVGFANSVVMPAMFMSVSSEDRNASTFYFSMIMSALTLGGFFCGVCSPILTRAIFGGAGTGKSAFILGGICQLITFFVFLVFTIKNASGKQTIELE